MAGSGRADADIRVVVAGRVGCLCQPWVGATMGNVICRACGLRVAAHSCLEWGLGVPAGVIVEAFCAACELVVDALRVVALGNADVCDVNWRCSPR
jgi:hypothetical protein